MFCAFLLCFLITQAKAAIQHEYEERLRNLEEKYKIILEDDGAAAKEAA